MPGLVQMREECENFIGSAGETFKTRRRQIGRDEIKWIGDFEAFLGVIADQVAVLVAEIGDDLVLCSISLRATLL